MNEWGPVGISIYVKLICVPQENSPRKLSLLRLFSYLIKRREKLLKQLGLVKDMLYILVLT